MTKYLLTESIANNKELVFSLSRKFECYSSYFVVSKLSCIIQRNKINVIPLNGNDLESFCKFRKQYDFLESMSTNDSIILFIATKYKYPIIVDDSIIRDTCTSLSLNSITIDTIYGILFDEDLTNKKKSI